MFHPLRVKQHTHTHTHTHTHIYLFLSYRLFTPYNSVTEEHLEGKSASNGICILSMNLRISLLMNIALKLTFYTLNTVCFCFPSLEYNCLRHNNWNYLVRLNVIGLYIYFRYIHFMWINVYNNTVCRLSHIIVFFIVYAAR